MKVGEALIEFDADFIATHAKSLLTQIVITNSEQVAVFTPRSGSVIAERDVILELTLVDGATESVAEKSTKTATSEVISDS